MQPGAVASNENAVSESDDKNQEKDNGRGKETGRTLGVALSSIGGTAPASATTSAVPSDRSLQDDVPADDQDFEWAADALAQELGRIAIELEYELERSGGMP
jgi:hypothetical protein